MDAHQIQDADELSRGLAAERFLLFKHSQRCPFSARAFAEYGAFVAAHPDVPHGWLDVIAQRPLAQEVAARTGVEHASPQALWIAAGTVAWHASHSTITAARLAEATGA